MLTAEADILAFDLDSLRLLRGYREAGLNSRADRAKAAAEEAKVAAEAKATLAETEGAAASEAIPESLAEEAAEPAESPKPERDKGDPWVDRIAELEFVGLDRLSELHGKLIAAGFLNFQIRNRHSGIEYRITNAGKQFLTRAVEEGNEQADPPEPIAEHLPEPLTDADADIAGGVGLEPDVIAMPQPETTEAA